MIDLLRRVWRKEFPTCGLSSRRRTIVREPTKSSGEIAVGKTVLREQRRSYSIAKIIRIGMRSRGLGDAVQTQRGRQQSSRPMVKIEAMEEKPPRFVNGGGFH